MQPSPFPSHYRTMELYIQCTLLPHIIPFISFLLSFTSISSLSALLPSPSPSNPTPSVPSSSDFFLELSHFLSTLFLSFFTVLHRSISGNTNYFSTWMVSKSHLLTLCFTTAFPVYVSSLQFLQKHCKHHRSVQGIVSLFFLSFLFTFQ